MVQVQAGQDSPRATESSTTTTISVVIPALNEEQGIVKTVLAVPRDELARLGYGTEVIVVDNGSVDRTAELARNAGARVVFEPRRGYGRAYKTGFACARGEIIATADADHSYPVEDIPKLVRVLEEGNLDFLTTNRFAYLRDGAMSYQHRLGNHLLNLATTVLFQTRLHDSQSGMWVFRRGLLNNLVLQADSMAFSQELKIEACCHARCRWKEIPIVYRTRLGKPKLRSWRDGFGNFLTLLAKRASRRKRSERLGQWLG
jgi:glycosyltransferase involved in cell wall biosynthesis